MILYQYSCVNACMVVLHTKSHFGSMKNITAIHNTEKKNRWSQNGSSVEPFLQDGPLSCTVLLLLL